MATTVETYMDSQQMCDYALLKHVNIGKEIADEKLYKRWTKLWVVVHSEVSPLDSFMGYCKKESKWLLDDQAIVKYSLNEFTLSRTTTKKHDRVMQLDFPSLSLSVQLCFDSQTKMDHYYQLLYKVSVRHHVDLVRCPEHPEKEGDYVIEDCKESYKVWKTVADRRGRLCWEWNLRVIRRIHFHKSVEKLEVEAGRSSETGEGHFFFTGRHAFRLFEAMKAELVYRAQQKQQNKSLPSSHILGEAKVVRSRSLRSTTSSPRIEQAPSHSPLTVQVSHMNGASARAVASPEESETSSEEYSPSDNSSSYTGTGGSVRDWTTCTPSPTPGMFERAPVLPPRVLESRPFSPSSTCSSSSSASGYHVPRRLSQPALPRGQYMEVNRDTMDGDSDYMTMNIGLQRIQLTQDDNEEDTEYTDMHSAGKIMLFDESSSDEIPSEFVEQYLRMVPNGDSQTATLTRGHFQPLGDRPSTPPPLPPHAALRFREQEIIQSSNAAVNSNTFPGTRRT